MHFPTHRWLAAVLAAGGLLAGAPAARTQVIAYEPFNYPAGSLANQTGGGSSGFAGPWDAAANNVTGPGLSFTKGGSPLTAAGNKATTAGGDVSNFRTLSGPVNSGTVFIGLLAGLDSGTGGTGYAGVSTFSGATETLFIGQPFNNGNWGLDQATGFQPTTTPVDATTHFFVAQIDYGAGANGNDRVRFYIDPTPGLAAPDVAAANDVSTTRSAAFDQIRIAAGSNASPVNFDELRVGTTFASVAPSPVPEPASLALTAGGLLGVAAGARRRRRNGECRPAAAG